MFQTSLSHKMERGGFKQRLKAQGFPLAATGSQDAPTGDVPASTRNSIEFGQKIAGTMVLGQDEFANSSRFCTSWGG